jgi:hypothetical protein
MQRVRLGSSAIEAVRYDKKRRTLDVEFREAHSFRSRLFPLLLSESPSISHYETFR